MHAATEHILANAQTLQDEAYAGDQQALITQKTKDIIDASGGMRLTLAKDLGGYEAPLVEFAEWAMAVAENQPSAGWICGVVGIHPWEISIMDERLQREIYVDSPNGANTWTNSPYAPFGKAKKVDGGYLFSGRWPYGTGSPYCEWAIMGGIILEDDGSVGNPPNIAHFVLPRADYEVVPDSWQTTGLQGTGSNDILVNEAFVPDYRVSEQIKMLNGQYAIDRRPNQGLFHMLFGVAFPAAIAAGTLGIARGAVRAYADHVAGRTSVTGVVSKADSVQQRALAIAESDVEASIAHYKQVTDELYQHCMKGNELTDKQRLLYGRDQRRATARAMDAVEDLYRLAGASAARAGNPLGRYINDVRVARSHICNVTEPHFQDYGRWRLTGELPPMFSI